MMLNDYVAVFESWHEMINADAFDEVVRGIFLWGHIVSPESQYFRNKLQIVDRTLATSLSFLNDNGETRRCTILLLSFQQFPWLFREEWRIFLTEWLPYQYRCIVDTNELIFLGTIDPYGANFGQCYIGIIFV